MTREEAITVLKAFMENPLFSDVHKQAFNIAIHDIKQRHDWDINNLILINKDNYEPLEQEPTPDDCETCIHNKGVLECDMYGCKYEPTTKNDVPDINVGNIYTCSCGYGWDKSKVVRHHFCPNCGKAVEPTTKNDLGVDAISRKALIDWLKNWTLGDASPLIDFVKNMPPVTPQEQITDLKVDCISRRAVIEEMEKRYANGDYITKGFINSLPPVTVTPQPRKGHWIHHDEERGICSEHWECSYCHKTTMTNPMYPYNDYDHMYYCPKCGADMRGEDK